MDAGQNVFQKLGGTLKPWPTFDSKPAFTRMGVPYFQKPGVTLLAMPTISTIQLYSFLEGFDASLDFCNYVDDGAIFTNDERTDRCDGTMLVKVAGQLCYMSFGPGRTKNAEAQRYVDNILGSGHGSVLEHAQYTWLVWGADRAFTHELVRHRTGVAFSQVSQRYVDGKVLRFVERPEWQRSGKLHARFMDRIDRAAKEYDEVAAELVKLQGSGDAALTSEKKTEQRKKVNQAARSCLPNETEAPIVMSGNVRALRHVCEMRAAGAADVPIREVTTRIFLGMREVEPMLFNDYELKELPDGTYAVETKWRKV